MRNKKVAVEKLKKSSKKDGVPWVDPEVEEFTGVIRHVGESVAPDLKVGQKVYFGSDYQKYKIQGEDLCVMEDQQILAIVNEEVT